MFKNFKAAIFDLDGTLIDSMWIWDKIDHDYLNSHGLMVPDDLKNKINHLTFEETAIYFKEEYLIPDSIDEILNTWNTMALENYSKNVTLKKGTLELVEYLKTSNIKIGLATSNSSTLLNAALNCTNILHYFDSITTTDEIHKGKSNPDVYLLAAQKLGVTPDECIVFEDILEAVIGAKKAGMKVIAVYDKSSDYQKADLIETADMYIYDFYELLVSLLEKTQPQ